MSGTARIVLIDEHQTFLDLLTLGIDREADLSVVGTARTAADGRAVVERTGPDVVLLESALPDEDGVELTAELIRHRPDLRVILLTADEEGDSVSRVASVGAVGLLAKAGALAQVISTVRSGRQGSMIIDPLFLARVRELPRSNSEHGPALTRRELDVLALMDQGKDPRKIARELSISLHTCRGHVKSLLMKLDCHSQLEAVITGRRLGLLPDHTRRRTAG
ncbi:MAG TPA: response regulator transcription factor [Mycobacteriales bacterium]|nr:response regulator transcription factor [Mycobacteriales bacterium]